MYMKGKALSSLRQIGGHGYIQLMVYWESDGDPHHRLATQTAEMKSNTRWL